MTDLDPLAKMLHDVFWGTTDHQRWDAATYGEKTSWRRTARLVDTMAVPNAPPPPDDLELRKWAIGLAYQATGDNMMTETAMRLDADALIAYALGQQVKP